ncbi:MAG: 2-alkenal reductase, partial [Opitutaceae bacterium]|nr:2-alkenal reductase [Opitutaceae bacterium]
MDTREAFEKSGQGHVFAFWDQLDEREKSSLLEQAGEIDLAELASLVDKLVKGGAEDAGIDYGKLEPAPYVPLPDGLTEDTKWKKAKEEGEKALRSGRVAAFTVAGGQGTRLGYDGPKGTFPVTPLNKK